MLRNRKHKDVTVCVAEDRGQKLICFESRCKWVFKHGLTADVAATLKNLCRPKRESEERVPALTADDNVKTRRHWSKLTLSWCIASTCNPQT